MIGSFGMTAAAATAAAPRVRVVIENSIRRNRQEIETLERRIAADGDPDGTTRARLRGLLTTTACLARDLD